MCTSDGIFMHVVRGAMKHLEMKTKTNQKWRCSSMKKAAAFSSSVVETVCRNQDQTEARAGIRQCCPQHVSWLNLYLRVLLASSLSRRQTAYSLMVVPALSTTAAFAGSLRTTSVINASVDFSKSGTRSTRQAQYTKAMLSTVSSISIP